MNNLNKPMIERVKGIAHEDFRYVDAEMEHEGLLAALVLSLADIKDELHQINLELRREKE